MEKTFDKLTVFVNRMKRLGIDIKLGGNYPWIYIDYINNKRVKETYMADHGFTVAFLSLDGDTTNFTDIGEIFKLIRRYI